MSKEPETIPDVFELPKTGYLRQSQLIPAILPFSAATLWRMVKARTFPKPVKLSERVTAWRAAEVHGWLNDLHQKQSL